MNIDKCYYPEECKKLGRCIRPEDHDRPQPCFGNPYDTGVCPEGKCKTCDAQRELATNLKEGWTYGLGGYNGPIRFTKRVPGLGVHDDRHRSFVYETCQGIDMIKLGIVLDKMVKAGVLKPEQARLYDQMAGQLLALILTENYRAHGL